MSELHKILSASLIGALSLFAPRGAEASVDGTCASWGQPVQAGVVEDESVDQLSGLAASHAWPGVLWAQEDAGEEAKLLVLASNGEKLGRIDVTGATNTDWEDLALGPCTALEAEEACACLYIADIGGNNLNRTEGVIWRLPEPDPEDDVTAEATAIRFRYPDDGHDAEALIVLPGSGELFILTKEVGFPAQLFTFDGPGDPDRTTDLRLVGTLDLEALGAESESVTGATVSPLGDRLIVRTNDDLLLFPITGGDVAGAITSPAELLPAPVGGDGEAAAFDPDGQTLTLIAEGSAPDVWTVTCADFDEVGRQDPDGLGTCAAGDPAQKGCGCASRAGGWSNLLVSAALAAIFFLQRRTFVGKIKAIS
jgi:hypothetical protein